ncbi:unnamed protein product [Brugia pahangi]|uniref:Uncharacterized protein n=1 Tax=Brugia pahangi TaxID=6280 RepID=A0A0N4TGI5_BRUPA|nr:unnamed protein product [Brugia pahangi]
MCAIQIKEICKDCPNSTVIEKLLEEANNSMNEFVGSILTVTNGNTEYSGTNIPDNNGVPQEEVVKLSLDEDVKIDAQRDIDQHEAKDHSPINKLEDNSDV